MHYPHKGINWDQVSLGSVPDTVIAARLGVASQVVQRARVRRAIPRFLTRTTARATDVDWKSVGLGERPDSVIARELDVSRRKVCDERLKQKIPPFVGLVLNQEGSPCRSVYEAMYDACLHHMNFPHAHEVRVPGTPFVADLLVEDEFVEIVGMLAFARYRAKYERKRRAYEEAAIKIRWVTSSEVERLYAECPVALRFRSERRCDDCREATHDLVKAVCRRCYMKRWHVSDTAPGTCEHCGREVRRKESVYCCRACYWSSLELAWPSWEELDGLLSKKSIRRVAIDLGVRPSTLYMRLRRRRLRAVADSAIRSSNCEVPDG